MRSGSATINLQHFPEGFSMKGAIAAVALATAAMSGHAATQSYPQKAITAVVPFPAGGSSDMVARVIGPSVNQKLGQPFVIDNRSGATGAIGAALVKNAKPDGHTILIASIGVYAINPFLQKGLQYDPARDFDLLSVAVRAPNVLVMNPALPAKTVQEFVSYLKKMPGKVTFASSGAGSSDHLTAALFWQKTGTSGLHVPYKGGAPAIADLLGGHADSSSQNINAILPHVQAGKLKALAITSEKRSAVLPKVPTMAESGVKDVEVYSWQAIAAPKGLAKDVKATLHGALVSALNEPQNKQRMTDLGFEVLASSPEYFEKFLNQELARWKAVITTGNITLD
jgi:tripartite-type tricarboxylate transporter receptor subunit TctC